MSEILLEQGYFRSADGLRLYYQVEGPKDAPPLLFCYGLVCSKLQWKYQMEHFKKNFRVIYMDYRGHGQSEKPEDVRSVTIENLAHDLAQLHEELRLPPVPVLGHSLGVNIILDFYRLYPEKVRCLVLANGTPKDPFETMFHHNFLQVAFPLIRIARELKPELVQKFWSTQGKNPLNQKMVAYAGFNPKYAKQEDINEYLRITSTVDAGVFLNLLEDFMQYDALHWLGDVKVPTLVVAGERDLITPAKNQKMMAELIPDAELVIVEEGSHCPQMEKIAEVNELLEKFLAKAERLAKAPKLLQPLKKGAAKKSSPKKKAPRKSSGRSSEKFAPKG